jgi:hypothetical protein
LSISQNVQPDRRKNSDKTLAGRPMLTPGPACVKTQNRPAETVFQLEEISTKATPVASDRLRL